MIATFSFESCISSDTEEKRKELRQEVPLLRLYACATVSLNKLVSENSTIKSRDIPTKVRLEEGSCMEKLNRAN